MKKFTLLFCLLLPIFSFAQDLGKLSGGFESYAQWYSKSQNQFDTNFENYFRSNNYLKLDYRYKGITAGVQLEFYAPDALLNFDPKLNKELGLATYYIKYQSKDFELTAGYFYEQFGSGLILRFWEDRQLGLNNALRGGRIKLRPIQGISFTALYGRQRTGFEISEGKILGLDLGLGINELFGHDNYTLNLGFSFVERHQDSIQNTHTNLTSTMAYSSRIDFSKGNFYTNVEYVLKNRDAYVEFGILMDDKQYLGKALLLDLGYSKSGLGINASFRRLENMNFYSERQAAGNIYNNSIINYLPSLTKQHDYSLANLYIYQTQSNLSFNPLPKAGEIGFQFDVYYKIKKGSVLGGKYGSKLAINYSQWHGLDSNFNVVDRSYSSEFLSFGEKYFRDFNVELIKKWSRKVTTTFTFINAFYNKRYIEETTGEVNYTILAVESIIKLKSKKSMKIVAQHLWTKDDQKNWLAASYEFYFSSKFSVFVADMYNYGNDVVADRNHYYNFGGNYSKGNYRLSLSYGKQRGGLLCLGGICRYVPESTGLSFSLNIKFK